MRYDLSPTQKTMIRLLPFLGAAVLAVFDQYTKYLAVRFLKNAPDRILIPGVFQFSYVENQGAAWGMFSGMRWVFLILTLAVLVCLFFLLWKMPQERRYVPARALIAMLAAGAVGNALDRLICGYVIDFFYFSLIDFPVFNVADCYVCISLVLLVIGYRNEDFSWLKNNS